MSERPPAPGQAPLEAGQAILDAPPAVRAAAIALRRSLAGLGVELPGGETAAIRLVLAMIAALDGAGETLPASLDEALEQLRRIRTEGYVAAHFDGRNHRQLAADCEVSTRTIRRIVARLRAAERGK